MKSPFLKSLQVFRLVFLFILVVSPSGQAQTSWNWSGSQDGNWANPNNWTTNTGGGVSGLPQGYLNFPSGPTRLIITNNFAANSAGFQIYFNSGAPSYTNWGNSLTMFDWGNTAPVIENDSANVQTVNFPVVFQPAAANLFARIEPNSGNLIFGSTLTMTNKNGTGQFRVTLGSGKTVTFNGALQETSGSGATFALNASDTVIFNATNTFSGDTFINNGTLVLATNNTVASAFLRLGDTTATGAGANLNLNGGNVITNGINVRNGSSGTKIIANTSGTAGSANYASRIYLDDNATLFANTNGGTLTTGNSLSGFGVDVKNKTLTVDGPGSNVISALIINTTSGGALVKNGSGTIVLAPSQTISVSNTGSTNSTLTVANTNGLVVGQGISGTGIQSGGYIVSIPSATQITISTLATNLTSATATITGNTYGGGTTVNAGTIFLGGSSIVAASMVTNGPTGVGNVTLAGGATVNAAGSLTWLLPVLNLTGNINLIGGNRLNVGFNTLDLGGATRTININGRSLAVTGGNTLASESTGLGQWEIQAAPNGATPVITNGTMDLETTTFTGGLNGNYGAFYFKSTVLFTNGASLTVGSNVLLVMASSATLPATPVTINGGGILNLAAGNTSVQSLSGAGTVFNSMLTANSTAKAIAITGTTGTNTFSGILSDGPGTGSLHLGKTGGSTLVLSGNNTYSGVTSGSTSGSTGTGLAGTLAGIGAHAFGSTVGIYVGTSAILSLLGDSSTSFTKASDNSSYQVVFTSGTSPTINVDQATPAGTSAKTHTIGALSTSSTSATWSASLTGTNNTSLTSGTVSGPIPTVTSASTVTYQNNIFSPGIWTFAGYTSLATNASGETLVLSGSGNTIVNGAITPNSAANGAPLSLRKFGTGNLTLNTASTYTNGTSVTSGSLIINNSSALGTSPNSGVAVGTSSTGTTDTPAVLLGTAGVNVTNTINLGGATNNAGANYTIGGNVDGNTTFSGPIAISKNSIITQVATTGNNTLTISGGITNASTSGRNITFAGPGSITVSTVGISDGVGSGALTNIISGGSLTLNAANNYSGSTLLNAGRLVVVTGGSASSSALNVASGATNSVQIAVAGSQWQFRAMTNQAGSYLEFNFGSVGLSATPPLQILGNLAITNPNITVRSTTAIPLGQYPLIKYTGTFAGIASSTATIPNGIAAGATASIITNSVNKSIDLVVSSGNTLAWSVGNGSWDINTTTNWSSGGVSGFTYQDGYNVLLDGTASGTGSILVTNTTIVSPASVTNNTDSTKSYIISGSAISGNGTLTKNGLGTLTLANTNNYTGLTTISAGTLQLGDGATRNGAIAGNAAIINNSSFVYAEPNNQSVSNFVSGSGTVSSTGAGTLTVAPTQTRTATCSAGASQLSISGGTSGLSVGQSVSGTGITSGAYITNVDNVGGTITIAGISTNALSSTSVTIAGSTYTGGSIISGGIVNPTVSSTLGGTAVTNGAFGVGPVTLAGGVTFNGGTPANLLTWYSPKLTLSGDISLAGGNRTTVGFTTVDLGGGSPRRINATGKWIGVVPGILPGTSMTTNNSTDTGFAYTETTGRSIWEINNSIGTLTFTNGDLSIENSTYAGTTNASFRFSTTGFANFQNNSGLSISNNVLLLVNNSFSSVNAPRLTIASNGYLDALNTDLTVFSLAGAGTYCLSLVSNAAPAASTLIINGTNGATEFSGSLQNGPGTNGVAKPLALSKTGASTQFLSGTNFNSGVTTVSGGALFGATGGSCSNSAVTVLSGATNGVQLRAANGQWFCGALTNRLGSYLDFDFNNLAPGTNAAPLQVLGDFAITNASILVRNVAAALGVGDYPLIRFGGNISGVVPANLALAPSLQSGCIASVTNIGSVVYLRVAVSNHAPVATPVTYSRGSSTSWKIKIVDLATNVTDADNDPITITAAGPTSTNGANVGISGAFVTYINTNLVNDQFTYTASDGQGGTTIGVVNLTAQSSSTGQSVGILVSGSTALLNFAGIPNYSYTVQRTTNLTSWVSIWTTNAPTSGLFDYLDDFSDLGVIPDSAYYRLRYNP